MRLVLEDACVHGPNSRCLNAEQVHIRTSVCRCAVRGPTRGGSYPCRGVGHTRNADGAAWVRSVTPDTQANTSRELR